MNNKRRSRKTLGLVLVSNNGKQISLLTPIGKYNYYNVIYETSISFKETYKYNGRYVNEYNARTEGIIDPLTDKLYGRSVKK